MPRNVIEIPLDELGIICNADAREQGEGAVVLKQSDTKEVLRRTENYAVYSKNVDPMAPKGRLQPITGQAQPASAPDINNLDNNPITKSAWITKPDGKYTLVFDNGTDLKYSEDFYGTTGTAATAVAGVDMSCVQANNQELHIGTGYGSSNVPKWIGYVNKQPFGGIGLLTKTAGTTPAPVAMYAGGEYSGTTTSTYTFTIVTAGAAGTPPTAGTFKWSKDGGAETTLTCATTDITIAEGITVAFDAIYGFDAATPDTWTLAVKPKAVVPIGLNAELPDLSQADGGTTAGKFYLNVSLNPTPGWIFTNQKLYRFKLSFEYDGYQESQLSDNYYQYVVYAENIGFLLKLVAVGASSDPTVFNKRLTGVNIYLAEGANTSESSLGAYRLVRKIDCTKAISQSNTLTASIASTGGDIDVLFRASTGTTLAATGNDKAIFNFAIESSVDVGATYQEITGRADSLTDTSINYALSCQVNGYHVVGKCYHAKLKEVANNMLFRSGLGSFDTFNWSTDFLNLPFTPIALAAFEGRVYVFGNNKILRVDPNLLAIEDVYEGVGIVSNGSPLVTDSGMYWFDVNSIYQFDGKQVIDIGYAIKKSYDSSFASFSTTLATLTGSWFILYSAEKKSILFCYALGANTTANVWVWSLEKLEWYLWTLDIGTAFSNLASFFSGKNGEIYINYTVDDRTDPYMTYKLFNSTNYLAMELVTKKYDAGLQNQDKKWYKAKHSGSSSLPTITYGVNDATYANLTNAVTANTGELSAIQKAKNIQFKITSASGATLRYLDTLEIVLRQLIGFR